MNIIASDIAEIPKNRYLFVNVIIITVGKYFDSLLRAAEALRLFKLPNFL